MSIASINKYYKDNYDIILAVGYGDKTYPLYRFNDTSLDRIKTISNLSIGASGIPSDVDDLTYLFSVFHYADFETEVNIDKWYRRPQGQVIIQSTPNFKIRTPSKESIYKQSIKPLMLSWIANNITNLDVLLLYKKFMDLESNVPKIIEAIEYVADQLTDEVSIGETPAADATFDWNDGLLAYNVPINTFFNDLYDGTNTLEQNDIDVTGLRSKFSGDTAENIKKLDVMAILGFKEALDDQFGDVFGSLGVRTAAQMEKALKADPSLFGEITAAVLGEEYKAPTAEELISLRQCALMTRLLHDSPNKISFSHYFNNDNFSKSPLRSKVMTGDEATGNRRIYPVDPSTDPNLFYNRCHISSAAKESLMVEKKTETAKQESINKKLFWVFEDKDGNLREVELGLSSDSKKQSEAENYYLYEKARQVYLGAGSTDSEKGNLVESILGVRQTKQQVIAKLDELNKTSFEETTEGFYVVNDIEIKYEGTNPSTARNDVQVQMSFTLSSLEALSLSMNATGIPTDVTGADKPVFIKLYELITLPISNKVAKGPGSYLENQYNPEYSRTRLKVYSGDGNACDLIIDLTTIDHSLNRESDTGVTTLTINYRGFFEAMMNMPFNDALADDITLTRREKLHGEAMSVIKSSDCTPELLNKALRMEQEIFRRESKSQSAASLLARLSFSNLIYGYTVNEEQISARAVNGTLDPFQDYVSYVHPHHGGGLTVEELINIHEQFQEDKEKEETDEEDKEGIRNKFFFLGDLLYVVSGCLYKGDTVEMRSVTKNMNMRFIIGTINVPNPKTKDGSLMTINPICMPIDVAYFIEWFNATIINKGITTYPVGIFMKELIERLINNIIFEVCFSSLLPSENPPLIRSTFISNYDDRGWFDKNNDGWFDPGDPYMSTQANAPSNGGIGGSLFKKDALFKRAELGVGDVVRIEPYNYCVIYQQFPTFSQYTPKSAKDKLRNTDYVPTIFYGKQNTDYNYLTNVSFAKTDSPFLREARYFNSSYGNLSLLSNVYDLNFSFVRRKANTILYPGIIINFILIDWSTNTTDSPYKIIKDNLVNKTNTDPTKDDYVALGQNNPHSPNTMAHILGFGGYYIIKSVTYKLGQSPNNFEISVSAKFMATDAVKKGSRKSEETINLEDKKSCVEAYNKLQQRVNELGGEEYYDRAIERKEDNSPTSNETRVIIEQTKQVEQTETVTTSATVSSSDLDLFNKALASRKFIPTDSTTIKGNMTNADVRALYDEIDALGFEASDDISGYYKKGTAVLNIDYIAETLYVNGEPR